MRRRRLVLAAIFALPSLVLLSVAWAVYSKYRIDVPERLGPDARAAAVASIRSALEGRAEKPTASELSRRLPNAGPVVVRIWDSGRQVGRMEGRGATIADALLDAAEKIAAQSERVGVDVRERSRISIDVVVGRGPLYTGIEYVEIFALHPGLEGLGVTLRGGGEVLLLPDQMVSARLLFAMQPMKFVPEFRLGLNLPRAEISLAVQARLKAGEFGARKGEYFRLRTDAFVEQTPERRDEPPIALVRGMPPGPKATADSLRGAAIEGGKYLVAHLAENGRYVYEVDLHSGRQTDPNRAGPYSLPRHAGTTYFLAELYRHTKQEFLREPIERAFAHLKELVEKGGCAGALPNGKAFACVVDKGQKVATLGSSALTVVALAEYRRATADETYDDLAIDLTEWMLYMQRPDGSFAHRYDIPKGERDEHTQMLYFSGEAALALARMYEVHGDPRYLKATELALDDLIGWYDFFAGRFFYGEEHWTCIASEAAWPALKKPRYAEFCRGYAAFLRAQQPQVGDFPSQPDLAGGYGFTPMVVPANTPAGSRTEAMISSYLLTQYHGRASHKIKRQILDAMEYALSQQIRDESSWNVAVADGLGAVPASPVDHTVRIDYVQHVCSAMIRTAALLDSRDNLNQ